MQTLKTGLILFFMCSTSLFADELSPVMHQNFQALMKLQPYAANAEAFSDPKNSDEIAKNIDALAEVGKTLPQMVSKNKPGLTAISKLFGTYILDMQRNFKTGNREFVRHQVRTVTGFCMECHTRTEKNREFVLPDAATSSLKLSTFERAELLAASRQFDRALVSFENIVLQSPDVSDRGFLDAARSIRNYLSISIRVKQDPALTSAFLTKVARSKHLSAFFARDLAQWKSDTSAWMKEKDKKVKGAVLVKRAKSLIDNARRHQAFAADHSGDVNFLRATNYLHDYLEGDTKGNERAEAFYLLGIAYAAVEGALLWELDGLYFEACIREKPHTEQAQKCFKQFASGTYIGYSGSSGTHIPQEELTKLGELKKLAN